MSRSPTTASSSPAPCSTPPATWATPKWPCATPSASLARRWFEVHEEIKIHTAALKRLTRAVAPDLVDAFGIGFDTAAEMLVTAGDNNDRIRCGPRPALRGLPHPSLLRPDQRQAPAQRAGNRQAKAVLYRVLIVRMRWHPPTIAYVARRTA